MAEAGERSEQARIAGMRRDAKPSGVAAAPAATVVLVRDGDDGLEVLLARRSSKLAFHGGAWVFPGGRIDPDDYAGAPDDVFAAAQRAAAREAKEEAGVDVRRRHARAPLELDDARDLAQALRDVVLRRRGRRRRGGRRRHRDRRAALVPARRRVRGARRRRDRARASAVGHAALAARPRHGRRGDARPPTTATPIDFTPRFHFIEGDGAVCVYREDVAYDDLGRLDDAGPRHRLYLRDTGWEYVRD